MGRTFSGRNSGKITKRHDDDFESKKPSKKLKLDFESEQQPLIIKKLVKKDKPNLTDDLVRLNKFIANAGVCSRRDADVLIQNGDITINDKVTTELGYKVGLKDIVKYKGKILKSESKIYLLLNKPKDYVTTVEDSNADKTVMDLISGSCNERLYPIGRLDKGTTGVLLFTNDGEIAEQLMHPKYKVKKVYQITLDKPLTKHDLTRMVDGFDLEDGFIAADAAHYIDDEKTEIGVEIHSGRNRIVRRMFEYMGYKVRKLDRVVFAGLTKKNVRRGHWRFLEEKEVNALKMKRFS